MDELRDAIKALRHKDPENSGYIPAYSYGRNEALDAVLDLIPEGSLVVPQGGGICHHCLEPDVESIRAAIKAELKSRNPA